MGSNLATKSSSLVTSKTGCFGDLLGVTALELLAVNLLSGVFELMFDFATFGVSSFLWGVLFGVFGGSLGVVFGDIFGVVFGDTFGDNFGWILLGGVFGGVFRGLLEDVFGGILEGVGDVFEEIVGWFSFTLFGCSLIGSRITSDCKLFGGSGFELSSMFISNSKKH